MSRTAGSGGIDNPNQDKKGRRKGIAGLGGRLADQVGDAVSFDMYLKNLMRWEFPEEELNKRLNILGQQVTASEQRQYRQFSEQYAGQTGGRMSGVRGTAEIGGQASLARAMGSAQLMQQAFNQELSMRQAGLNAYIQKYGYDKQAQMAQAELDRRKEESENALYGDIFSSMALLYFLL